MLPPLQLFPLNQLPLAPVQSASPMQLSASAMAGEAHSTAAARARKIGLFLVSSRAICAVDFVFMVEVAVVLSFAVFTARGVLLNPRKNDKLLLKTVPAHKRDRSHQWKREVRFRDLPDSLA